MTDETQQDPTQPPAQDGDSGTKQPDTAVQEPPAQDGDEHEVAAPVAVPQLLPTVEQGLTDLADNPGRTSVLTEAGHLVRE